MDRELADQTPARRASGTDGAHTPNDSTGGIAAELDRLHALIKERTQEKQRCSRLFGAAKAEGADLTALRQQMQHISLALGELERQRKDLQNRLDTDAADDTREQTLPPRFTREPPSLPVPGTLEIQQADDRQAGAWDDYVRSHPNASLYHRYAWRTVIARAFGHETLYLMAISEGAVRGVLPIVRLNSRLFGDFAVSMPFFNYGGALADNPDVADRLLARAAEEAGARGLRHLEIRSTASTGQRPARTDKVSMLLRLPPSAEQLDRRIGAKVRSQIKRARQENPEVATGGAELLDEFYRVFAANMRDLGTPVYGKSFFRIILDTWPGQAHLVVLRLKGKPVAAAFLLGDRDMMEIPWASTLRSANPLNMNMLLYWHVLQFSIERGYAFFDFGRSTRDSGTYRFKKQWGAQPVQHFWHYWLADGAPLPDLKPDNPKFRLLIQCWQHLPVCVTRWIGPAIVQYLP